MSDILRRQREIANGQGGDVRLARQTIDEIERLRDALFMAAPSHQGGHSDTGMAIAQALDITFPIRLPELQAKAVDEGLNPDHLWPWLKQLRQR